MARATILTSSLMVLLIGQRVDQKGQKECSLAVGWLLIFEATRLAQLTSPFASLSRSSNVDIHIHSCYLIIKINGLRALDTWHANETALGHSPKVLIFDACPTWAFDSAFIPLIAARYKCKAIVAAGGDHNRIPKMEAAQIPLTRRMRAQHDVRCST